jgi:PAS domain S-box-containing protein
LTDDIQYGNQKQTKRFPYKSVDYNQIDHILWLKSSAVDQTSTGIIFLSPNGKLTYCNDAVLKIWGWNKKSLLGSYANKFAQFPDQVVEIFKILHREGSWFGEIGTIRKDRSLNTVRLQANMIRNTEGDPICFMCSFVDVTDKKYLEEQILIKDRAIEKSINGIIITDIKGNIHYVNEAFYIMWGGVFPDEVIGKPISAFTHSKNVTREIYKAGLKSGKWFGELAAKRRDGSVFDVQCSMNTITDPDMDAINLVYSFVDITDRKTAERKLKKHNVQLEIRVIDRTKELESLNRANVREIEERKQAEKLLLQKEKDLIEKSKELMEINTALQVLLKKRELDRENIEKDVFSNVENSIIPHLKKLQTSNAMNRKDKEYVAIIETQINNIVSPFTRNLSNQYSKLTPAEIKVSNLIKDGSSTKEISELLNISSHSVEFHRKNIRKKLVVVNKKVNLRSYLLSLA